MAYIKVGEKTVECPITVGTEKEVSIDIANLRSATGAITMDHGYANTGSCESAITFLDGENGILQYRGYPIDQLAEKSNFLEVSWLLLKGELPTKAQYDAFDKAVRNHTLLREDMKRFFESFPRDAHPMAILSSAVLALSAFYDDAPKGEEGGEDLDIVRLLAKLPTLAAAAYRQSMGLPFAYPDNTLDYAANFLQMMFSYPTTKYVNDPNLAKALNLLFILHADHEQNCSTSTVRMVGSSQASVYASIAAGICALWGPLHGGANQAVLEMLEEINQRGGDVKWAVAQAKDKTSSFRLMGFGHRVYKNFDPRAKIIKKACDSVLNAMDRRDPLLDIARQLEEAALTDDYFISKKLYPNVDFYSGILYRALNIPVPMFTVMFALGRLPGWLAQWKEMRASKNTRIGRPRQIYTGYTKRDYVPMDKR